MESTEEEPNTNVGNFERQNTPHPKPQLNSLKPKKNNVDGHPIPHEEEVFIKIL